MILLVPYQERSAAQSAAGQRIAFRSITNNLIVFCHIKGSWGIAEDATLNAWPCTTS